MFATYVEIRFYSDRQTTACRNYIITIMPLQRCKITGEMKQLMVCQLLSQWVLPGYLCTQFEIVYKIAGMPVLVTNKVNAD